MPVLMSIKIQGDLYNLIASEADRKQTTMIDVISELLANGLGHPELAEVPRQRSGRPRTKHPAG